MNEHPTAPRPLHILHLEDDSNDAELIAARLKSEGLEASIKRVDNCQDYTQSLKVDHFDLILADFRLAGFDGIEALSIAKREAPGTPFIFVSGFMGEERAIKTLKEGATDYILKNNLNPLVSSIQRALHDVEQARKTLQLEEDLRQSQKMEAIGRLAGGIAHDFNNLLTIISGYSELLLTEPGDSTQIRQRVLNIKQATERATFLTGQLLSFTRRQVVQPRVTNINEVLFNNYNMLGSLMGENIELVILPSNDLWNVKLDPDQLRQVILNLAGNARDAMPAGGKLFLESSNVVIEPDVIITNGIPRGEFVQLIVRDTGVGMSEEVKRHLFEPYFTTKERGKGTGLGLSTSYGIIKASGGYVHASSEIGQGSTFAIYFPRVMESAPRPKLGDSGILSRGTETILLAEDEPALRELFVEMLSMQGFKIFQASNGAEALEIINRNPQQKFHLLITDVIMPIMGGKELAEKVKSLRPETKILFMSGYVGESFKWQQPVFGGGAHFIQKPFTPEQIVNKVRKILDRRERPWSSNQLRPVNN